MKGCIFWQDSGHIGIPSEKQKMWMEKGNFGNLFLDGCPFKDNLEIKAEKIFISDC